MKEYYLNNFLYYRKNDFLPNRQTLVFVHGLSGSSSAWLKYEQFFQNDYNLLSFDLRGHGKSVKPKKYDDYDAKEFANDLRQLLLELSIDDFFLISHSFGTLIALEFLDRYQKMVKASIFLSPNFRVDQHLASRIIKPFLSLVKIFDFIPFSGKPRGHIDYKKYPRTGDWNLRRMRADIQNTTPRVYLYCTKQSYKYSYETLLEKIDIPVLLVHGRKDTIFPVKRSIIMSQKIKNARLHIIEDTDHIVVLNNFDEIAKVVREFIIENS